MTKNILTILMTVWLFHPSVWASECYHYHTSEKVKLIEKNGQYFIINTTIDPNGVSVADEFRMPLPFHKTGLTVKFTDYSNKRLVLKDETSYYYASIPAYDEDSIRVIKIAHKTQVSSFFNAEIACIDGKWTKLNPDFYRNTLTTEVIENFPDDPEVISQYKDRSYILKSGNSIYTFYPADNEINKIEGLNIDKLQSIAYTAGGIHSACLLTDGDMFLQITYPWLTVNSLNKLMEQSGVSKPYRIKSVYTPYLSDILQVNESLFEISGESINVMNNTYWYNNQNLLLERNGKVYLSAFESKFERNTADLSQVENVDRLHLVSEFLYSDGIHFYNYDHDNSKFIPIGDLPANTNFVPGITSYMHGTTRFYDDGKQITYMDGNYKIYKTIQHNTPIKDLETAYAYDNKLLIEDKTITHQADYNTLSFVGSTVDVISPCDGGRGQIPIEIEYNYFFKDKKHLYFYHTGDKTLRIVPKTLYSELPEIIDYTTMRALQNKLPAK